MGYDVAAEDYYRNKKNLFKTIFGKTFSNTLTNYHADQCGQNTNSREKTKAHG